jgi:hypothetical protein
VTARGEHHQVGGVFDRRERIVDGDRQSACGEERDVILRVAYAYRIAKGNAQAFRAAARPVALSMPRGRAMTASLFKMPCSVPLREAVLPECHAVVATRLKKKGATLTCRSEVEVRSLERWWDR